MVVYIGADTQEVLGSKASDVRVGALTVEVPATKTSHIRVGGMTAEVLSTHGANMRVGGMTVEIIYQPLNPITPPPTLMTRPDWGEPIIETIEWLTDIQQSETRVEQRRRARWTPRRFLEVNFQPSGNERSRFDLSLAAYTGSTFYLPDWADQSKLTAACELAAGALFVSTIGTRFVDGGYALLRGANSTRNEIVKIASISSDHLTLANPTANAWPIGAKIYPVILARIFDTFPALSRKGDRAAQTSVKFFVQAINSYAPATTLPTYRNTPVLTKRPDESNDLNLTTSRSIETLDGMTGDSIMTDMAGFLLYAKSHSWLLVGRTEYWAFMDLIYSLQGSQTPIWVPTFSDDMTIAADIPLNQTFLDISPIGLVSFGIMEGRQDIYIEMADGTFYTRRLTGAAVAGSNERLTVDTAFPAISAASVRRISFMVYSRLASDSVEITHLSDMAGASQVTLVFQSGKDESTS